jgi:hypothetical protein
MMTLLGRFLSVRWLVLFVGFLFLCPSVWAAPAIGTDSVNYDFGEILQGDQVEYVFRFRNVGDEVLQVGNVRSSCGCTAALLSATRIAPGEIGELRTTFDSERFKGGIHKTIVFDTNDPRHPQVTFAISGNVKAELLVEPERLNWRKVTRETRLEKTVKIINRGSTSINLQSPKVTNRAISAQLSGRQLDPGDQLEVKVTAEFPQRKDRISGYVIIDTDYSKVPQLRISVSARLAK